jgi:hypothetical protein
VEAQVAKRARAKAAGGEHNVLLTVDRAYDEIGAMHIQGYIAVDLCGNGFG